MRMSRMTMLLAAGLLFTTLQASSSSESRLPEQQVRRASDAEVRAFLQKDPEAMARLWSDDFVVTNPLNKFVNKQDVLGMVRSGFLVITSYDRRIEYVRV